MKNEKGITIISLILYIILLTFAIAGMSAITSAFYSNINQVEADSKSAVSFAKINMVMLNDVKSQGAKLIVDESSEYRLNLEVNGDPIIYRIQNDALYRNDVKICDKIRKASFIAIETDTKSTITIDMTIDKQKRRLNYVIEPKMV